MEAFRRLTVPACILALALVVIPLADTAAGLWPLQPANPHWRFGAFGVLSRALLLPALGAMLLLGLSLGHRRRRLLLGVVFGATALLMCAGLGLFALDALEVRAAVRPELLRTFDAAAALAVLRHTTAAVLLLGLALAALTPFRDARTAPPAASIPATGLLGRSVAGRP